MMIGLILFAVGIVATIKADIGYAPWEVFHVGLADTMRMSIGLASILAGIVIVILVTALGEKFGFGTVTSMVLTGVFVDVILLLDVIPTMDSLIFGILLLVGGLFAISAGSSFYIKSAFGVGPRDNLMVVMARRTKLPVGVCRGIVEALTTLIGWLLGGMVGIGTIVSFIAIGPCVQLTFWVLKFDVTAVKHETMAETFAALRGKKS